MDELTPVFAAFGVFIVMMIIAVCRLLARSIREVSRYERRNGEDFYRR